MYPEFGTNICICEMRKSTGKCPQNCYKLQSIVEHRDNETYQCFLVPDNKREFILNSSISSSIVVSYGSRQWLWKQITKILYNNFRNDSNWKWDYLRIWHTNVQRTTNISHCISQCCWFIVYFDQNWTICSASVVSPQSLGDIFVDQLRESLIFYIQFVINIHHHSQTKSFILHRFEILNLNAKKRKWYNNKVTKRQFWAPFFCTIFVFECVEMNYLFINNPYARC